MTAGDGPDRYRCPYCSVEPYTSPKEREVRLHIELASDDDHLGRSGFKLLTCVEAVDADGSVVEEMDGTGLKREPDEFEEICSPDPDLPDAKRRIIATKMMYPDHSSREIVDFLDEKGESVSRGYVRNTIRNHFATTELARCTRSYEEFNDRQQAAIDAVARCELGEFETQAEAAEAIDEGLGYLRRYSCEYEDVVDRRMKVLDGDDDVTDGEEREDDIVRREKGTATYVGSEKGIDATMQHFSERPAADAESNDEPRGEPTSGPDPTTDGDHGIAAVRGQIKTLQRLVVDEELDVEAAFDEVEQILADVASA